MNSNGTMIAPVPAHAGRENASCLLCGSDSASIVHVDFPGYVSGLCFAIQHCPDCDTSAALPHDVSPAIYDRIYASAATNPGYRRYARYFDLVQKSDVPLNALAAEEDVYWATQVALDAVPKGQAKILEVGSGLGYLTYALRRHAFDCLGIDISQVAIDSARQAFGDYFQCTALEPFVDDHPGQFDVVVALELLEHVPDILALMRNMDRALKPGGRIILSTPNKSAYPADAVWASDLPPIHLWWLSEHSIRVLARHLGYTCTLVDFSEFNRRHWDDRSDGIRHLQPEAVLYDEQGLFRRMRKPWTRARLAAAIQRRVNRVDRRGRMQAVLGLLTGVSRQRSRICAVMTKTS